MLPQTQASRNESRGWVRALPLLIGGLVLGALAGACYAALVGGVHLALHGGFGRVPTFAGWSVALGAVVGLALGALLILAGGPVAHAPLPPTKEEEREKVEGLAGGTSFSTSVT